MANNEYTDVEQPAIELLQELGYTYVDGKTLSPDASDERSSWRDVILEQRLRASLMKINPWLSDENLNKVVREVTHINKASLLEANQHFYETMVRYISVDQDLGKGRKGQTVKLIDFENHDNNEFLVVNQFKVQGPKQNIIPDIVIFVNGIPLGVIECKSPYISEPMHCGIDQLQRYCNGRTTTSNGNKDDHEGAERLFWYNQVMISTYRDCAKLGTISSRAEHFLEWKDPYPLKRTELPDRVKSQDIMLHGVFRKENFLNQIRNFIVFEPTDGKIIKKYCRYQQYRAVQKTIERIKSGRTQKDKGGIVWHTQGSGKSLTMVFLASSIRRDPQLHDSKLVFVTDRTDLDRQLSGTFERCQDEHVYRAKNAREMKEYLKRDAADIVTCMVQKFREDSDGKPERLNESDKVIVMVDEAHRSQYSSLAMLLNYGLPNAVKIGFTGTPLIKSQKTSSEFGSYIDTYKIDEAVKDGATVQIIYQGHEANTKVTGDSLDALFKKYFGDLPKEELAEIIKKHGKESTVLEAPKRIEMVCHDIVEHYRTHIQPDGFKAMIVCPSRRSAITYHEMLNKLEAPESAVIISSDHNDSQFFRKYTDGVDTNQLIERFKKPLNDDGLSFLIVKDMLLTGFDAPNCQVMYLDRKLKEHTLLQAIARVNRTAPAKSCGFIVDYYGLSDYLVEALDMFSKDDIAGALKPLKEELPKLESRHARCLSFFEAVVDKEDIDECVMALEDEEIRAEFQVAFKKFTETMNVILPDAMAAPFVDDLKWLGKIHIRATRLFRENIDVSAYGQKVQNLIHEHVYALGIDIKVEPMAVFEDGFEYHVQKTKSPRARASEIEHAIKHHITVHLEEDPEYYKTLSKKLKAIIDKRSENWDEQIQLLFDLRGSMITDRKVLADDLGLTDDELAFYNLLKAEVCGDDELEGTMKDELKRLTNMLIDELVEVAKIVDFFSKADEQKRIKNTIKRELLRSSLDIDMQANKRIREEFMNLARPCSKSIF